ncbi:MAG TPA: subclass B3 metallo-beta-lactamase [Sphingomicrobium sp.]|nr:subclass B3 metallo-beta-lactamase [Sphingomicrobium sp.]
MEPVTFVSLAFFAAAQIVVPLGKPPAIIEQPIAPIETAGPRFAAECKDWDDWDKPAPPVRIHGNTYLVGTCGISSILITDRAGDILIDGGPEDAAGLIANNIESLGFNLHDVKILLYSHEHSDHVGGLAKLQQLTGAQVYAAPAAAKVLETGLASPDDPQQGINKPFPGVRVDHILSDGEQVRLGNTIVTAVETPGHTPGALTWHWGSCDGGVCRQIVYADSLTPKTNDRYRFSDHPAYLAAYRASIAKVAALNCEILLSPHPSASDLVKRLGRGQPLDDPNGCRNYAADLTKQLDERLAKERAGQANPRQ